MNRIVLDVEATGFFGSAKVYDFGGVVVDYVNGETVIVERFNFVVEEIFYNDNLMKSAYYAEKIPQYYDDIFAGVRKVATFDFIRSYVLTLARKYKVKEFWAYNAKYDKEALEFTSKMLLGRSFLPENMSISYKCIMGAFMSTKGNTRKYCKFAEITEAGRVRVNAENAYRYVSGNIDFVEEHTGLADALIECEILKACLKCRKKMDTEPKSLQSFRCYQEIQRLYKSL